MKAYILIYILFAISLLAATSGCGGKSSATGEVVPIQRVCSYEKLKPVAIEGFLAPETIQCERVKGKRTSSIAGCKFKIYSNSNRTGAAVPIFVFTADWFSGKNNRLEDPESYLSLPATDREGNPLPKKDLQIYDNDAQIIPANSKIRVYSQLHNTEWCELGMANRIEVVN